MRKKKLFLMIALILAILSGWLMWFVNQTYSNEYIQNIHVSIQNPSQKITYQEEDILSILTQKHGNLLTRKIKEINTMDLLSTLSKHPWFKNIKIYLKNQTLYIELGIRNPIARLFDSQGRFYFLDDEGYVLPSPDKPVFKTLVVNGKNIPSYIPGLKLSLIDHIPYDSLQKLSVLSKLYTLTYHIENDTLMRELISQVYIKSPNQFELITFITQQPLMLGDIDDLKTKFTNIRYFFKYGIPQIDIEKYASFHFQYINQVVGIRK
ncbi:MAG: hypothetical protein N2Z72_01105 [Bacteroidales bacterium]|nr:hypothetical protein [Bacteroidales bacterium]